MRAHLLTYESGWKNSVRKESKEKMVTTMVSLKMALRKDKREGKKEMVGKWKKQKQTKKRIKTQNKAA